MSRALAALLLAAGAAAAEGLILDVHGLARRDGILRVGVRRAAGAEAAGGPVNLRAELRDGAELAAAASVELPSLAALADGVVLVLVPAATGERPLRLVVTLARPTRPGAPAAVETAAATVATPASTLAAAAAAAARLRAAGETDPLPWLWAEQAADCAAGGAAAVQVGAVAAIAARLKAWADGWRPAATGPGSSEHALRDPVDGSVQPWRLHLPPGAGPFPVALLRLPPPPGLTKAHWPSPPAPWLAAAAAAGVAVVECHPAGDRAWNGAAARREGLALAAAAHLAPLDPARTAVAADPARGDDPAWWRALPWAPPPPPPRRDDLAAVFTGPFVIVVGGGDHAAARGWNRRLADALRAAYGAHAAAIPPLVGDDAGPADLAGRNLVLIGNPRSNRVLAGLGLDLPFAWDHRAVRGPGGFTALRADSPPIACLAPLPGGHLALVLDGAPPAWGDGLPLAGLHSPWMGRP